MSINIKPIKELNILLVSNTDDVIEHVKRAVKSIDKNLVSGCHLWRCEGAVDARAISIRKRYETDIVLVCLYEDDAGLSLKNLGVLLSAFSETPIITLTRSADNILALTAIEEGAASNVTDDELKSDFRRLKSAMEYSLARYKNARTGKLYLKEALHYLRRQNKTKLRSVNSASSKALKAEQKHSAAALQEEKKHSAKDLRMEHKNSLAALKREQKHSAQAIGNEKKRSEKAMAKQHEKHATAVEEKEAVIRWLSGGYSVEKIPLAKSEM